MLEQVEFEPTNPSSAARLHFSCLPYLDPRTSVPRWSDRRLRHHRFRLIRLFWSIPGELDGRGVGPIVWREVRLLPVVLLFLFLSVLPVDFRYVLFIPSVHYYPRVYPSSLSILLRCTISFDAHDPRACPWMGP